MFPFTESPYLVPFEGKYRVADASTEPPEDAPGKKKSGKLLEDIVERMNDCQRRLYAQDRYSLLLVFQAMDAAGKDGTIRAVMSGINPAGCQVFSFKAPSALELDHDFLWRSACRLPERGRIGIFNRSYYEEVLVVRVHPEYLKGQRLPRVSPEKIWEERFESIRDHEKHLARNGTVILKFWLNVSRDEQKRRFLDRIDRPEKNWKFSRDDVRERGHWNAYQNAYEEALRATSRPWAPWYAVPADSKPYLRYAVADIVVRTLDRLHLRYPRLAEDEKARLGEMRAMLESEKD
jgi:PPK2 family polyphosphate:nucleotide phosphotransferase